MDDAVVARVVARTGESPELVAAVVEHETARMGHARITAYLPVLLERAALRRLRELKTEQQVEGEVVTLDQTPAAIGATTWGKDSWMA